MRWPAIDSHAKTLAIVERSLVMGGWGAHDNDVSPKAQIMSTSYIN